MPDKLSEYALISKREVEVRNKQGGTYKTEVLLHGPPAIVPYAHPDGTQGQVLFFAPSGGTLEWFKYSSGWKSSCIQSATDDYFWRDIDDALTDLGCKDEYTYAREPKLKFVRNSYGEQTTWEKYEIEKRWFLSKRPACPEGCIGPCCLYECWSAVIEVEQKSKE